MKVTSMMVQKEILRVNAMFHDAGVKLIQLPYDIEVETKDQ